MRSNLIAMMLGASLITTSACASKSGTGAAAGAVGGGVVGGVVGGRTGLLVGAALGGLLGYGAGKAIEEEDRRQMAYALEANQPVEWRNPETGYQYQLQPTRTIVEQGRECREFRMFADVGDRPEEVHGTACRQPDGSWEMLGG